MVPFAALSPQCFGRWARGRPMVDLAQLGSNAVSAMVGAGITGLWSYLAAKHSKPSQKAQDFSTVVEGFNKLVADLQSDHERLSGEIGQLRTSISLLSEHIETLEDALRTNGIPVPARPALRPVA